MAQTPRHSIAHIQQVARLRAEGKGYAEIAVQLYGDKNYTATVTGIGQRLLKYIDNLPGNSAEKAQALQARGFTLTQLEMSNFVAHRGQVGVHTGGTVNNNWNKPKNDSSLNSSSKKAPHSLAITIPWLLREGIPYSPLLADNICTQKVGDETKGNICGERISHSRVLKGCTTCQQCDDAVRDPVATARHQANAAKRHPVSTAQPHPTAPSGYSR